MAYLLLKARKKVYHGTSSIFRAYGKSVSDHPGIYCIVGILIAVLSFVGIPLVKVDETLDTVWMEKDSRFISEQETYVSNFGDIPRLGVTAFSDRDGGNIMTHKGLESLQELLRRLYAFEHDDSLRMEQTIEGKVVTMSPDDFCERPNLPATFKPTDPTDPLSYVRRGAYQSYGYVELLKCVHKQESWISTLPDGWGIDKTPCMRVTVLDCFKEGGVDYPENMKILEDVGFNFGLFMQSAAGNKRRKDTVDRCLDDYETKMRTDMETLSVPDASYRAAQERFFLQTLTWQVFIAFGYGWRPSVNDFDSDEELIEHIQLSIEAPFKDPKHGIENCIMTAVTGGTPRCCMIWAGTDVGEELYMGGRTYSKEDKSKWTGITSFRNPVVAQPPNNPHFINFMKEKYGIDEPKLLEKLVLDWEKHTIDFLLDLHHGKNGTGYGKGEKWGNVKIDIHTDRSTGDMAVESGTPESHLLILGGGLLFVYSFIVMGSFSNKCINSNILTMFVGLLVSGMSVVGSSGIMGFLTMPTITLSVLVQLAGFILCLGNVYILMFTFNSRLDTDKPVEDNMVATIEFGGHVIFVISATLFCGFLCGVYVPIPGFRSVCIQLAAICFLSFMLQMFIFMPAMVWNCKRTQDNRMDCIPVKRQDGKPPKKSFLTETKDLFKNYPTIRHSVTKQSLLSKFANSIYGPVILNKVVRIIIIGFFIIYFGGTAYVTLEMTEDGLMMSDVAKPGSYQASFSKLNEEQYEMFSAYIVTKSTKYSANQRRNMDLYESLAKNDWLIKYPPPQAWDWLSDGQTTLTGYSKISQDIDNLVTKAAFERQLNNSQSSFLNKNEALFRPDNMADLETDYLPVLNVSMPLRKGEFWYRFRDWLGNLGALSLPNLSCVNPETEARMSCLEEGSVLVATRTAIYMRNLTTHKNILDAINAVRDSVDEMSTPTFETFVYGFTFGFWGLYINLRQNFVMLCGCVLVGVVIPIAVFHCSLNAAFLIAVCMIVGLFQIFGSFWMLGVNFNAFTLVPMIASVAIVVQHSIFVLHSFIGLVNDRKQRAKKTLSETFPAIFSSVFSLFLLIAPLAFTEIPFIRSYICFMFLSVAFTASNIPLLLLPCILSLMGPRNFDSGCEDGDDSDSDDEVPPTFIPAPIPSNDFKQPPVPNNNYTRLTLRSDDVQLGSMRHYETVDNGSKTSPTL